MSSTESPRAGAWPISDHGFQDGAAAPRSSPRLGAWPVPGGASFRVWAPEARSVEVVVEGDPATARRHTLEASGDGTHAGTVDGLRGGDRYRFLVDGKGPFPDPASRFQPEGVHRPSEIVDPARFAWNDDAWRGVEPRDLVIYELHVGTFSPEGTFEGVIRRLPHLRDLGVTAVELMPLHEFAGARSWGYDGVALFAPSRNYGRPDDLRRLVDAAHALGLAVLIDVVYNHFGPVGNYAVAFSPHYLSRTESSDWAACVNLQEEGSERVREFFIENARHWVREYHADGLRLDATHALIDAGTRPLVAEIVDEVRASVSGRRVLITAEDHRNDAAMLRPRGADGWGLDAVWADDLHHQVRRHVAGDDEAYYRDYTGSVTDMAATINQGWFYTGQHSLHMGHARGTDPSGLPPRSFVVCIQNHDQVGNRPMGDRLHHQVEPSAYRAATALLLSLPQTPLLFMGQEWSASAPFQYFTDHDAELGKVVTEGRRREFRHFRAFQDPHARELIPDPQDPATFARSRLNWEERKREPHANVLRLYTDLLRLRRVEPALRSERAGGHEAFALDEQTLLLRRDPDDHGEATVWVVVRFRSAGEVDLGPIAGGGSSRWEVLLTTEDAAYAPGGGGPVRVDLGGAAPVLRFDGPAAVILRQSSAPPGGA